MKNLLWTAFSAVLVSNVICSKEYDMEDYCGSEISMIFDGIHQGVLTLDMEDRKGGWTCEAQIESWYSWSHIMFYFDDEDIPDCRDGFLQLLDGETGDDISGLPGKICGSSTPSGVFTTKSRILKVRYVAILSREHEFSIVFTAYSSSSDQECYEHECSNGRCIHKDATCTGHNSCGDHSDCKKGLEGGQVAGIVIGVLLGLGLFIGMVIILCCRVKIKHAKQRQNRREQASVVYRTNQETASTHLSQPTSFAHPTYGVTNQAFVAAQNPAYPVNFQYRPNDPSAPMQPPPYSELYPGAWPDAPGSSSETKSEQVMATDHTASGPITNYKDDKKTPEPNVNMHYDNDVVTKVDN